MASQMIARSAKALFAGALLMSSLAGCGTMGSTLPVAPRVTGGSVSAQGTAVLQKSLTAIHKAIFAKLDVNKDTFLDEYEATTNLTRDHFRDADTDHNMLMTYDEFYAYSTHRCLFFDETPVHFAKRQEHELGEMFKKLDINKDKSLDRAKELTEALLTKAKFTYDYSKLKLKFPLTKFSDLAFKTADRTHDGKLNGPEFEDLYVFMVVEALGSKITDFDLTPPPDAPAPIN